MNRYKLNNEEGVEQGFIETEASQEVVQENWNKVRSDVYFFEERRFIESVNAGVTGTKSVNELTKLLEFKGYSSEILDNIDTNFNSINAVLIQF